MIGRKQRKQNEQLTAALAAMSIEMGKIRKAQELFAGDASELPRAIVELKDANAELTEEVRELRAGVQVLMDMLGDAGMEITEEQLRREKDFTDGLNAIMNFDFGRPAE